MPRRGSPYGEAYRRARARILAGNPMCAWCGVTPATTADHDPPLAEAGYHLNLVPACRRCNLGRLKKDRTKPSRRW